MVSHGCALLCVISLIWSPNSLTTLVLTCLYLGLLSKTYNILVGATVLLFPTSLRFVIYGSWNCARDLFEKIKSTTNVTRAHIIFFVRAMAVSLEMIVGRLGSIMGNFIFPVLLEYGCASPIINLSCFSGREYFVQQLFLQSHKVVISHARKYIIYLLVCILLTCFLPSTRKHAV